MLGTQVRLSNVWDDAAMESFFSSLKTERTTRRVYRTRNDAKADVFDYIERIHNPNRRHSTIGLSPMEFEQQAGFAGPPQEGQVKSCFAKGAGHFR
jgi:putative transposase